MALEKRSWRPHRNRLWGGLGLRARGTATFAIGAFALSTIMAGITYFTARQSFLNERQAAVQRQAFANASFIQNSLRSQNTLPPSGTQLKQLIESVDTVSGSSSVLKSGGQWYVTSISVGQNAIPAAERALVLSGTAASQLFSLGGTPQIVIGVPLPAAQASRAHYYFEGVS